MEINEIQRGLLEKCRRDIALISETARTYSGEFCKKSYLELSVKTLPSSVNDLIVSLGWKCDLVVDCMTELGCAQVAAKLALGDYIE